MRHTKPGPDTGQQSLANSLLAQAAAGITLAAALIYGAGALTVALRLYFTRLRWEAVLGELPRDFIITAGFGQVVLPASIVGILGAILLNFLVNQQHESEGKKGTVALFLQARLRGYLLAKPGLAHFASWFVASLVLGAVETAIPLRNYVTHRADYLHPSVVIPGIGFFVIITVVSAIAIAIALILFPPPRALPGNPARRRMHQVRGRTAAVNLSPGREWTLSTWQWCALSGLLVTIAVIPGVAATSASTPFPQTLLCSPAFRNGYLSGNLIGTNGGWAYMVEYRKSGPNDYSEDYFSVVPLSAVRLMAIGRFADCATLARTPTPTPSAERPKNP